MISTDVADARAAAANSDRESNTAKAYRELRRRILDNEMSPNVQYLEQELAELLAMSRTPVREALIRLADERLVEVRPRHGIRVLPVMPEDLREIYEVLAELEAAAARAVAERGPDASMLASLESMADGMERALAAADLPGFHHHDRQFHALIVDAAGNRRLKDSCHLLVAQSHRPRLLVLPHRPSLKQSVKEHRGVIAALRARDAAAAHRLQHQHCSLAGRQQVEILGRLLERAVSTA